MVDHKVNSLRQLAKSMKLLTKNIVIIVQAEFTIQAALGLNLQLLQIMFQIHKTMTIIYSKIIYKLKVRSKVRQKNKVKLNGQKHEKRQGKKQKAKKQDQKARPKSKTKKQEQKVRPKSKTIKS